MSFSPLQGGSVSYRFFKYCSPGLQIIRTVNISAKYKFQVCAGFVEDKIPFIVESGAC